MAEKVGLLGVLDLKDFNTSFRQYTSSIDQMNAKTLGFTQNADGGFTGLGASVLKTAAIVGTAFVAASGAATVAVGAFVASGISGAIEMEAQLDTVSAILGATTEEAGRLKQAVFDLGLDPNLKVTSEEAATAMELLARNGLSVNEIIGETGDIADSAAFATVLLANATGTDFGNAADIATDAMAIFNKTTAEMGDTVSSIVAVTTKSKFTIDDYSLALRNGGAAAFDMGVSLEEFNTAIAASAEELGTGMKAGTGFRNFLFRLTPNTQVAADAMRDLGLVTADGSNIFFDANGELKDMADITRILNQALFEEKEILYEVGGRTAQQNEELNRLRDAYNNAAQNVRDYELGIKGATLTDEARNKRLEEQNAIMINAANGIAELESIQGELATSTVRLTTEQRSMALETIFGADALGTVLALAKEGAPAFTSVEEAVAATGLSIEEATKLVEDGTTAFELLYSEMEDVSALEIAETRMDNVAGAMEILQGIIEGVKLQVGDAFLPVIRVLVETLQDLAKDVGPVVVGFFSEFAGFIETVVGNLQSGLSPLDAFVQSLEDVGKGDLANRILEIKDAIVDFIVPIVDFVSLHKDAFIGAIQGIGAALAAAAIASLIVGIVAAIIGLFNPITLIIGAAALLGAAWKKNWFGIRDAAQKAIEKIEPFLTGLQSLIKEVFGEIKSSVEAGLTPFETFMEVLDNFLPDEVIQKIWTFKDTIDSLFSSFQTGGIEGLITEITTQLQSVDWATLGQTFVDNFIGMFASLGTNLGELISGWITTLTDWVNTVDWQNVGSTVVDGIIVGLGLLVANVAVQLAAWYAAISGFVESADWLTIATNLVNAIISGLESFIIGVQESLQKWFNVFLEWAGFTTWQELGLTIVTNILLGLANFLTFVWETLASWEESFKTWVASVDWLQLGLDIVTFIITGLANFALTVGETLTTWAQSFTDWYNSVDWLQLGVDIVTFIIDGLANFVTNAAETFGEWRQSFIDWLESVDWEQLGHDITLFIVKGLKNFVKNVVTTLKEWYESFTTWEEEQNWEEISDNVIERILKQLLTFADNVGETLASWYTGIKTWFETQDWKALAGNIISGIIKGITEGFEAVNKAVSGLVNGIISGFSEGIKSDSPSKVFIDFGHDIADGLVKGLDDGAPRIIDAIGKIADDVSGKFKDGIDKDIMPVIVDGMKGIMPVIVEEIETGTPIVEDAIRKMADTIISALQDKIGTEGFNIFDFGAGIGSFGSAIVKRFEDQTLNPLKERSAQIEDVVANLQKRIGGELGVEFSSLKIDEIIRLSKGEGEFKGVSQRAILGAKSLLNVYEQQETVNRQIREEQEKIAALQKAQADLAFLKQQMDFLDFLREQGLDAAEILNGVTLGLNADLPALLEAMTAAMQAVVQAAEDELQIASPSKIFEKIGQFTIGGFVSGVQDMAQTAQNSMRDFTRGVVSSVTGNMGSSNISNNNSRNLAVNLNNNFTGNPQITDKSQLEMALASFV